jgi:hypothetical protein
MQEDKWFEAPTWNHEKLVTEVFIILKAKASSSVMGIASDYLRSVGFHQIEIEEKGLHRNISANANVINVDLVKKSFKHITGAHMYRLSREQEVFSTFPSHIPAFLETHRGRLLGTKFGL